MRVQLFNTKLWNRGSEKKFCVTHSLLLAYHFSDAGLDLQLVGMMHRQLLEGDCVEWCRQSERWNLTRCWRRWVGDGRLVIQRRRILQILRWIDKVVTLARWPTSFTLILRWRRRRCRLRWIECIERCHWLPIAWRYTCCGCGDNSSSLCGHRTIGFILIRIVLRCLLINLFVDVVWGVRWCGRWFCRAHFASQIDRRYLSRFNLRLGQIVSMSGLLIVHLG